MVQINFKRGFQRIFSVICLVIILIGGFISWNNAVSDANKVPEDNIQLKCIKEIKPTGKIVWDDGQKEDEPIKFCTSALDFFPIFESYEKYGENFNFKLIRSKYSPYCELNKKYLLNNCLIGNDSVHFLSYSDNNEVKIFVTLNYSKNSQNIDVNEFAKVLNMEVVEKPWYEHITVFISSFLDGFIITLIVAGCVYGVFLLFVWMFAGFKKGK